MYENPFEPLDYLNTRFAWDSCKFQPVNTISQYYGIFAQKLECQGIGSSKYEKVSGSCRKVYRDIKKHRLKR